MHAVNLEHHMANHPNRSKRYDAPDRNPTPEEIRAGRESAGLTQREAARLIHCTERGWQDWEGGQRKMHPAFWELFRIKLTRTG
jgi:DNA (cytosine-5)-methyltransferase 1